LDPGAPALAQGRWLATIRFDHPAGQIVLQDGIHAVEDAVARRDRLTGQIEDLLPRWSMAPVVAALQAMRGVALIVAVTLVAEAGDLSRFDNPRQLMAYLGLVPSEHSSGQSLRRGGITKAGNGEARRVMVEAAWSYRLQARGVARASRPHGRTAQGGARHRLEGRAPAVRPLPAAPRGRQAGQPGNRRHRPRDAGLRLGHRPARQAATGHPIVLGRNR
jgi:transposase